MLKRLGIQFELLSDPEQTITRAFGVQNPDTQELALHAVYIVATNGSIVYRKVASRRPTADELVDALDAHAGRYPIEEDKPPRQRISVAYPQNNFQALLEISKAQTLPRSLPDNLFAEFRQFLAENRGDDATMAFKKLVYAHPQISLTDWNAAIAFLVKKRSLNSEQAADATVKGQELAQRLSRSSTVSDQLRQVVDETEKDLLIQKQARIRAGLAKLRAEISLKEKDWKLRRIKTGLRGYREVAKAAKSEF